jgi:hypothetical protein
MQYRLEIHHFYAQEYCVFFAENDICAVKKIFKTRMLKNLLDNDTLIISNETLDYYMLKGRQRYKPYNMHMEDAPDSWILGGSMTECFKHMIKYIEKQSINIHTGRNIYIFGKIVAHDYKQFIGLIKI